MLRFPNYDFHNVMRLAEYKYFGSSIRSRFDNRKHSGILNLTALKNCNFIKLYCFRDLFCLALFLISL
jgi:hypothetical protein